MKMATGHRKGRSRPSNLREQVDEDDADVAYASASGLQRDVRQGQTGSEGQPEGHPAQRGWWEFEPRIRRVANGVPHRSHRIRGLGNAVVPQIPELIGRTILEYEASQ